MIQVLLKIQAKDSGTIGSLTTVDITEDMVNEADGFVRNLSGDSFFSVESDAFTIELWNRNRKYYPGYAPYFLRGCQIDDEGKGASNWRMERIEILEDGVLRFVGYIFSDDQPISYNAESDTVMFTVYDPTYLLKLHKMGKPAGSANYVGDPVSSWRYNWRYLREVSIEDDNGATADYLYVIDKDIYDSIPGEEQLAWEKHHLFDTYGGYSSEPQSPAYESRDLHEVNPIIPENTTGYRRRLNAVPEVKNIRDAAAQLDLLERIAQFFNHWCPFFQIRIGTVVSDIDMLTREFLIQLDHPEGFSQIDIHSQGDTQEDTDYVFLIAFYNGESDNDNEINQRCTIHQVINNVTLLKIVDVSFPSFPPNLAEILFTIYVETLPGETRVQNYRWRYPEVDRKYRAAAIVRPSVESRYLTCYRFLRREYETAMAPQPGPTSYYWEIHEAQYDVQYFVFDLLDRRFVGDQTRIYSTVLRHHLGRGMVTPIHNFDWNAYHSVTRANSNIPFLLDKPEPTYYFDSNAIPNWGYPGYRYYSPSRSGPGVFLFGSPTMNGVALDYLDASSGDMLTDFAKITNSFWKLIPQGAGNVDLMFAKREFGIGTVNVEDKDIVSITTERYNLNDESIPEISTGIVENDSYNKALSKFYAGFFGNPVKRTIVEVIKDSGLSLTNYDIMWKLQINGQLKGIITHIQPKPQSVIFHATLFSSNRQVRNR